jgi:lipoprotein-anchoring transpeptidase ErfK/SrfK
VYAFLRHAGAGHDGITMEYFVAFNPAGLGYGFHSIPVYADGTPLQGENELGFFRSAGCVRQRRADAISLWNWARVGDPVVILGS